MSQDNKTTYAERLKELVLGGALIKPGIDKLFKNLKAEFPETLEKFSKKRFIAQVDKIAWSAQTREAFRRIIRYNLPLEKFTKYHPYFTPEMIETEKRKCKGLTRFEEVAPFLRGMGRIGNIADMDGSFELPKSSQSKPYEVASIPKDVTPQICLINGTNIGLKYPGLIEENPTRRALSHARKGGADVVILTNPFNIDNKKAAVGLRVQRAFASGLNINPNLLDSDYKEYSEGDDVIYETVSERFLNVLSGLIKIVKITSEDKRNKLEFDGPILVVFGYIEEKYIYNAAAWDLGYQTRLRQEKIEAEIRAIRSAIGKEDDEGEIDELRMEQEKLVALKSRIIQSNIPDEVLQTYGRKAMHFVVSHIEDALPNIKIIGQGTTHVKIGNQHIELDIPSHEKVTDGLLASFNRSFGARSLLKQVARTTVICHPYSFGYRMTAREINVNNKRAVAKMYVAPILVDGEFLREALKNTVRKAHPISKVVFSTQFSPGILWLNFYNNIVSANPVPIHCLSKQLNPKYIWTMVATDPHFGSRMREEVWHDAVKGSLGVSDAVIQMMRDTGLCENGKLPIHMYTVNDDPTQGNHFDTHKQPHANQMSYQAIEKHIRSLSGEEAKKFALEQLRVRGSDWLQEQMQQVLERHLQPNKDFFSGILHRVEKSKLIIKGISEIHGDVYDSRDLGAINWGTGNHFEATVDRVMTEGIIYAMYLRALLTGVNSWKSKEDLVNKLVAAPLEGNQYFAWGTVQVPGGYEWAIEFRSDPPRMSGWEDPLAGAVSNDATRGDYGLYMTGHKTLKVYGDKHFFAAADTEPVYYHMGAPGVKTDLYGHHGFPPNNTGVSFIGLPADGPESGPILLQPLHVEHIIKYFNKPYRFNWEEFLPNPA